MQGTLELPVQGACAGRGAHLPGLVPRLLPDCGDKRGERKEKQRHEGPRRHEVPYRRHALNLRAREGVEETSRKDTEGGGPGKSPERNVFEPSCKAADAVAEAPPEIYGGRLREVLRRAAHLGDGAAQPQYLSDHLGCRRRSRRSSSRTAPSREVPAKKPGNRCGTQRVSLL